MSDTIKTNLERPSSSSIVMHIEDPVADYLNVWRHLDNDKLSKIALIQIEYRKNLLQKQVDYLDKVQAVIK